MQFHDLISRERVAGVVRFIYRIITARKPEEAAVIERAWRDEELKDSDNIVARHRDQVEAGGATTLSADQYKELQTYRIALRNWPESSGFPVTSKRPNAPAWLAAQIEK
jgi:hypothetical protein